MPLFSRFQLEEQIDRIYQRKVELPSGGSIVIDGTEALTAIDVNSGRATRGKSQEETAVATNLEAAREVARQLRMRDIGGLVVVDFIDMRSAKHRREVEKTVRDAMKDDKARTTASRLSENGLLEINRQRLKKALQLRTHRPCPTCIGTGTIASPELVGLNILRRIETRAVTGRLGSVRVELHPELADALQNERRQELAALEREFDIQVEIVAAGGLHRAEERIDWRQRPKGEERTSSPAVSAADLGQDLGRSEERRGETETPKTVETDPSNETTDQTTAAGDDAGATEKPKPRRRRRGGRRRKKTSTAQTGAPESTPEQEIVTTPEESSPSDGDSAETPSASSDEAAKAAPKKRRRRPRRSRKKAAPTEAPPKDAAPPEAPPKDAAPPEAPPENPVAEKPHPPDPFSY